MARFAQSLQQARNQVGVAPGRSQNQSERLVECWLSFGDQKDPPAYSNR
jgi:hypothetical protein